MKNKILTGLTALTLPCTSFCDNLIPREQLFQNSISLTMKISPNGERIAFIKAENDGTANLYVSQDHSLDNAEMVTDFKEPSIMGFYWLANSKSLILLKDKDGRAQYRLYHVNLAAKEVSDLTAAYSSVNVKIFHISPTDNNAVIGIRHRHPIYYDLYLLDCQNKLSLLYQNDQFIDFLIDDAMEIALKVCINEDHSWTFADSQDRVLFNLSAEDALHTESLKFDPKEKVLYLLDNRGSNTTQLKKIYIEKNLQEVLLGSDPKSDITSVYFENNEPLLYTTYFTEQEWHPLNKEIGVEIAYLASKLGTNFEIKNTSKDYQWWVLKNNIPERGIEFWLYNRSTKGLFNLYSPPQLAGLSKTYPVIIRSRDGLELVSYLSIPREADGDGKPVKPLPLVVFPHGGPFKVRDYYHYSPYVQWLTNRGYAVIKVNFRLSSGFGKDFVSAGDGQWGKKAHEDILDAVQWCIDHQIAIADKVALFGGSYGGFVALSGLTFSPTTFACAVAVCGPSNLKTVLDKVSHHWEGVAAQSPDKILLFTKKAFIKSMGGDPDIPAQVPYLESCSPLNHVDNIQKPLLLVHGMNDHIVASSESDQIYEKMVEKKLPAIYLCFPDEGHGIGKFSNMLCFLAYSEWMLSKFLGGQFEPISEDELQSSSAVIQSNSIEAKAIFNRDKV